MVVIDISIAKKELQDILAMVGGCSALEVQVEDIRTSRGDLGSDWIRCPIAAAGELRGHLCYKCGGSGHGAMGCLAVVPKCPLCESFGAPAAHRVGRTAYVPLKAKRKSLN